LGRLHSEPSNDKPSPSDEIVELLPPGGNSTTLKIYRHAPPPQDLPFFLSKGYTIVEPEEHAE